MEIEVKNYDLPDIDIFNLHQAQKSFSFWHPDKSYLVLGQSNQPETSLIAEKVLEDNIVVYKRPSGGESVILTPKTLVISAMLLTEKFENPSRYFEKFNHLIISTLSDMGVEKLGQRGISDIAIGPKKILGSSIYRRKNRVFYHAVLNVSESVDTIARYLKHPKKEPDYRKGRNHGEFVTSLHEQGYNFQISELTDALNLKFREEMGE